MEGVDGKVGLELQDKIAETSNGGGDDDDEIDPLEAFMASEIMPQVCHCFQVSMTTLDSVYGLPDCQLCYISTASHSEMTHTDLCERVTIPFYT